MGKRRLKLGDFTRILGTFGVECDRSRGKGGHILFFRQFSDGKFTYPVPNKNDVLPCYVKGARKKFRLTVEDGVSDDDFFGR